MAGRVSAVVPLDGRGPLVFEHLHEQPLYLSAVRALSSVVPGAVVRVDPPDTGRVQEELGRARVSCSVVDAASWWAELRRDQVRPLVVHDPVCPLTPTDFLSSVAERVLGSKTSYAAVRHVTDTVKTAAGGHITGTIDRNGLVVLSSPVAISAAVMDRSLADDDPPPLHDVSRLVGWLRARGAVETVTAPSLARRVDDASSVHLLECVDELHHQLRQGRANPAVSGGSDPTPRGPA